MIDIEDRNIQPSLDELRTYADNPLFSELISRMADTYRALAKVEYSGDKVLLGWNVKFKKGGRTLCTVYPRKGHFFMLLIVGQKEKARAELLLPTFSETFRSVYESTKEGMGQRWLLFDFSADTPAYRDAWEIIRIRREAA